LGTDTGIVGAQTVTTATDGTATFTFRSGVTSLANRTATITANAGATAQLQVQILGSTLSIFSSTGSTVPNDASSFVDIVFIAKNAQGTALVGTPFTASWVTTGGGQLTLTPTSGVTDANGKFTVRATGVAGTLGTATLSATAAGSTASATINVTTAAGAFGISKTTNSTGGVVTVNPTTVAMTIADALTVTVVAPAGGTVRFTTTQGSWVGGTTTKDVAVSGGIAEAVLTQTATGTANVQVADLASPTTTTDNLTVGVTAVTAYRITLTASPTVVAKSSGTSTGTSTLVARVLDANNQPVGNAAVSFSMSNTTGGGESVSPPVAYTATIPGGGLGLGEASATFTSGSLSSAATGVQVRATVQGTTVATEANLPTPVDVTPSGNDATIVIGGTAGSITIGVASQIIVKNTTTYQLPMSVRVSDANGNPVANTTVNLSVWPIGWSTATLPCTADWGDPAGAPGTFSGAGDTTTTGTFFNEDVNENLMLDPSEDGYRKHYLTGLVEAAGGTRNGKLTPLNSDGGSVPASVITDASGSATFNLEYIKDSAIWTIDRIRATAVVQGTEAVSTRYLQLIASETDVTATTCFLTAPYGF
jgi:protocatechuate 3,4-dioxygenase beta subunit